MTFPMPQPNGAERRQAERLRPAEAIRVSVGRGEGIVADISSGGARVRHTIAVRRGARVRIAFTWNAEQFEASAEVLASQVASLGDGNTRATVFESRLQFVSFSGASRDVLQRVLTAISSNDLRAWVANLHGWNDSRAAAPKAASTAAFIRCRLIGMRWETKWTHDTAQPKDGFLLPTGIDKRDLLALCDTYARSDEDGRHLIRLMAVAAVDGNEITPRAA